MPLGTPYAGAKEICQTLFNAGYTAYIAGGWVRDLLLSVNTDEIDIATNASPTVIQSLFSKTVPVGIAFGVVIVIIDTFQYEVSTFRKDLAYVDGRHPTGVDFSTPEHDAMRRDFTINGMFYDPLTETLYDYVNGQQDLKAGIIRAIGNPQDRFTEDKLRMMRAVRFAARLQFCLEEKTLQAIKNQASTLFPSVSIERVWQELSKMAHFAHFDQALVMLHELGLLSTIFPSLKNCSKEWIQKQVAPFSNFPSNCPLIPFLLELFPSLTLQEGAVLSEYLKLSKQDAKSIEFFINARSLFQYTAAELWEWAHFYAHPLSQLFLQVFIAKQPSCERQALYKTHAMRQNELSEAIKRIKNKTPLIAAHHLQQAGIPPGKKMGLLLKEAERLSINHNLSTADDVLKMLSQTSIWQAN